MTTKERWILSEFIVARDRATRLGEKLLRHRERTPYSEVDLIFQKHRQIILVEVKTVHADWDASFISSRQLNRLAHAREYIEEKYSTPTDLIIALVSLEARTLRYVEPRG